MEGGFTPTICLRNETENVGHAHELGCSVRNLSKLNDEWACQIDTTLVRVVLLRTDTGSNLVPDDLMC